MGELSRREVSRLGKRGSYRFGWLRVEGPQPRPLPEPHRPTFRRSGSRSGSRPGSRIGWLLWCAAAAAALGAGASLSGLWWLPFVAGLLAGFVCERARSAVVWVVLAVCAGWGAALWWPALTSAEPAGATARVVAALAGLPPFAAVGVVGTLLIGALQGIVAVWLARALRPR